MEDQTAMSESLLKMALMNTDLRCYKLFKSDFYMPSALRSQRAWNDSDMALNQWL